jgi:catechol 2,3-dioxygenase-like lactoylglutathione lyase family enzyme
MSLAITGSVTLLQVFDMPTSLHFYRDLLGFQVVQRSQPGDDCGWAWLRLNEVALMLNTAYEPAHRPAHPDPARIQAHEDVTLYFGCPDVDAAYSFLQSIGIPASEPKTAPYGMRQLSFRDPDGYGICCQWAAP